MSSGAQASIRSLMMALPRPLPGSGSLALHRPGIGIAQVIPSGNDPDRPYRLLAQALHGTPGAVAVYNTGGANRAVARAIEDHARSAGRST